MMTKKFKFAVVASLTGTLWGCASHAPMTAVATSPAAGRDSGLLAVQISAVPGAATRSQASDLFNAGRTAHGSGQLMVAAERYQSVLELDPTHVGALNALAVINAQNGQTDAAIRLFAQALALAPEAAYVHNNAGYALMKAGQLGQAREAFGKALQLNPSSVQAQQNMEMLAKAELANPGVSLASAAKSGSVPLTATATVVTATDTPAKTQPVVTVSNATAGSLVAVAKNVYELKAPAAPVAASGTSSAPAGLAVSVASRMTTPVTVSATPVAAAPVTPAPVVASPVMTATAVVVVAPKPAVTAPVVPTTQAAATAVVVAAAPQAVPAAQSPATVTAAPVSMPAAIAPVANLAAVTSLGGVKLEVSNGAGVNNLAKRTAQRLEKSGVAVARLTNMKPFRQTQTVIQYAPGQEKQAQALQARMPYGVTTVAGLHLKSNIQLRLVLGRDVGSRALAQWLSQEPVVTVALSTAAPDSAGWMWS